MVVLSFNRDRAAMESTATTLSDSNDPSGSSSVSLSDSLPEASAPEVFSLRRLSENLESVLDSPEPDSFADARIVVASGRAFPVHRCILAARSPFFRAAFSFARRSSGGAAAVEIELKDLANEFEIGSDSLVAVLAYLYSGKVRPPPKDACVCVDEECDHVACWPAVELAMQLLYASFVFQVFELVTLYQRHLLEILHKVAVDDILLVLSIANTCGKACERLLTRCIEIVVKSNIDRGTLERTLPQHIVKQIIDSRLDFAVDGPENNTFPDKHAKRIHRALDSDDVELVRMLLKESHYTLDDAHALHYAVAYCDAKITTQLLDLGLADVNYRNSRGYTVLHVAAMKKEPKIIVSLLAKGARPSDLTPDGRKALQISKRSTRATEEGRPRERLCIEILEQAERRDPLLGEASFSLAMAGDDLRLKLLYLENRVGLAKLLFPLEAKVAMDIAQVDGTTEFHVDVVTPINLNGVQRTVDLYDGPSKIKEEHLKRMRALTKTVELGKCFFPRCSDELNKIMDADDLSELAYLSEDTPEERLLKKRRFMEIEEALIKAFLEDKEEFDGSGISSSSPSTMLRKNRKQTHKI